MVILNFRIITSFKDYNILMYLVLLTANIIVLIFNIANINCWYAINLLI